MLGVFSLLLIAMFVTLGFIAWHVVTFTRSVESKVTSIQHITEQKLNLPSQLCATPLSSYLGSTACH
jgi:hypothetical protein